MHAKIAPRIILEAIIVDRRFIVMGTLGCIINVARNRQNGILVLSSTVRVIILGFIVNVAHPWCYQL